MVELVISEILAIVDSQYTANCGHNTILANVPMFFPGRVRCTNMLSSLIGGNDDGNYERSTAKVRLYR